MEKYISSIIKWFIAILITYFLVDYFIKNYNQIVWTDIHFNIFYLILSIILVLISYLLWPVLFWLLMKKMGIQVDFKRSFRIFFSSQLGRYVPGKALLVITRVYMLEKENIKRKDALSSVILDLALFCLSGILLFLISIPFTNKIPFWIILLSIILAILYLILIHPKILTRIINFLLKLIREENISISLKYSQMFPLLILHIIRWLFLGIGLFFFARSIMVLPSMLFFIMPGIVSVSIVIGMITLITPSGLGVREGLTVLMLGFFITPALAVLFSLTSRIILTIFDVVLAVLFELTKPLLH